MATERTGEGQEKDMRRVERRHLVFYLRVFDGMSNRVLGHVVDISTKGVMLISDQPITVNEHHLLRMRLPSSIANKDELLFNATSKWCKQDINPDFYVTGFEIQEVSEEIARYILCLVDDFGFRDPS
ncbi:MAG: PilZ domain-containing protein [Desulfobulbaceae bacterium]|nr:MAG: PilZ domain-containing protein [Desulfobulbaceae bacterium]